MGRGGRKRKDGPRHPGGQLIRKAPDDRTRTSRQPHRRLLRTEDRLDERAESPLGRLLLRGHLTTNEERDAELVGRRVGSNERVVSDQARMRYEAGAMLVQVVGAYRSTIEAPRGTAGSGQGQVECIGSVEPAACLRDAENCACLRRRDRYTRAYEALAGNDARRGRRVQLAVTRAVVYGEAIEPSELINLVAGLDLLVRHFGLTTRRGGSHYQNAN